MKAVSYKKYGSTDVIGIEIRKQPIPKDDEILIKIHGTVVSPPDCAERQGKPFLIRFFSGFFRPKNIPGDTFAGYVEKTGKNVEKINIGDRVYGSSNATGGGHAEYKCLSHNESFVKIPKSMDYGEAAAICEGFLTALPFLRDNGKISKGKSILINGASGSVGTCAIQLARYFGAETTGVCSGKNMDLVKDLGANYIIDYTQSDYTKNQKTYDIIFDAIGKNSFSKSKKSLKDQGIYMTTVPSFAIIFQMLLTAKSSKKKAIFAATGLRKAEEKTKDLHLLNDLIERKLIKPVIDKTYTMEEIAEAHKYVETGHKVGNVVIKVQ